MSITSSNGARWVQFAFRLYVGLMGIFLGCKYAKVMRPLVYLDSGSPLRPTELVGMDLPNTKKPAGTVRACVSSVLNILGVGCLTQIANPVVCPVTVNVVDGKLRSISGNEHPGHPVRVEAPAVCAQHDIPIGVNKASLLTSKSRAHPACDPDKYSGLWVVLKNRAQFLRSKIVLSHDALQMLIGQRPACVGSASRASLF